MNKTASCLHSLIQRDESQSHRVLFSFKNMSCSGMGKKMPKTKSQDMFLKVELALILHGFLNMRLSCECNGDRRSSRNIMRSV